MTETKEENQADDTRWWKKYEGEVPGILARKDRHGELLFRRVFRHEQPSDGGTKGMALVARDEAPFDDVVTSLREIAQARGTTVFCEVDGRHMRLAIEPTTSDEAVKLLKREWIQGRLERLISVGDSDGSSPEKAMRASAGDRVDYIIPVLVDRVQELGEPCWFRHAGSLVCVEPGQTIVQVLANWKTGRDAHEAHKASQEPPTP